MLKNYEGRGESRLVAEFQFLKQLSFFFLSHFLA